MKILKSLFVLTIALSLQSCNLLSKAEDLVPELGGTMTAKVDNKDWKATSVLVVGKITGGQLFSIGGTSLTARNGIGLNFDTTKGKIEAGKTYTCGPNTFAEITHDTEASGYYQTSETGGSGSITVSKFDGKTIEGTFSGTLIEDDKKRKVVISAGTYTGTVAL
jgi:hypothetical protein